MKTTTSSAWLLLALGASACGNPGRPHGLPPPEYEVPKVEPWPAASAAPSAAPVAPVAPSAEPAPSVEPTAPAAPDAGGSSATLSSGTP